VNARVRRASPLLRVTIAAAIGAGLGAGALVFTRTELRSLEYEHGRLVAQDAELQREIEKLEIEAAALATPDRIEDRAFKQGLRYPSPGQIVHARGEHDEGRP
jgi:cell division protein FtsL